MASFSYSKYLLIGLPVVVLAGLAALWWERNERKRSYKEVGRVSDLFIYPVKSCKGIRVNDVKCFKEGMEYDRHWVLVDADDTFVSQRKDPKLVLVVPHFEDGKYLCLNAPGMETLKVDIELKADEKEYKRIRACSYPEEICLERRPKFDLRGRVYVVSFYPTQNWREAEKPATDSASFTRVWRMCGEGQYVGDEAAQWFSSYLNKPGYKMYQLSQPRVICEDDKWGDVGLPDDKVSFGNFAPYMIANEASLVAVNDELPSPVTMERFRPNVVVTGLGGFEEDKWTGKRIKVGDVEFRFLKRCGRCPITTVNPATGEMEGEEPLATLRRIRLPEDRDPRQGIAPLFGVHVAPDISGVGAVRVGDSVMVSL